jgi:hypothetical protein
MVNYDALVAPPHIDDDAQRDVEQALLISRGVVKPCARCGLRVVMLKELGLWRCRYHPHETHPITGLRACCQQPEGAPGCVRCDHQDSVVSFDRSRGVALTQPLTDVLLDDDLERMFAMGSLVGYPLGHDAEPLYVVYPYDPAGPKPPPPADRARVR